MYLSVDDVLISEISTRIATLIKQERLRSGFSALFLEKKLKIRQADLLAWESGSASPPAYLYFRLMKFLGTDSYRRAAELDLDVQVEIAYSRKQRQYLPFRKAA